MVTARLIIFISEANEQYICDEAGHATGTGNEPGHAARSERGPFYILYSND